MPTMPLYGETTDPKQHLMRYEWKMNLARAFDAMKCRCFLIFLGLATIWFARLFPRSISSFTELSKKFIEQFCLHTIRPKHMMSLSNLYQAEGDSPKNF